MTTRRAVTLVELLIVIAIIAILAAMLAGLASVAMTTAREARTRNLVTRIHSLLSEKSAGYALQRVKLDPLIQQAIDSLPSGTKAERDYRNRAKHEARLYAAREQMLVEMPDRWSDVTLAPIGQPYGFMVYCFSNSSAAGLPPRAGIGGVYLREYDRLKPTVENQSAECLYLTIMHACGEGESASLFGESDIGDTDGDGAREFLDGWGRPISWLRWGPGFESDIQADANELLAAGGSVWVDKARSDHDPMDVFRIQDNAYRLQPVVYSMGNDERAGIWNPDDYVAWLGLTRPYQSVAEVAIPLRPLYVYGKAVDGSGVAGFLGTAADPGDTTPGVLNPGESRPEDSTDNVHSHLITSGVR